MPDLAGDRHTQEPGSPGEDGEGPQCRRGPYRQAGPDRHSESGLAVWRMRRAAGFIPAVFPPAGINPAAHSTTHQHSFLDFLDIFVRSAAPSAINGCVESSII